jgi:hypothetical protein
VPPAARTTAALVRASHPEPTVAVTAIATALAVSTGLGARSLWVAAAFLSGQLSVGWSNDWIDAARDARNGRADKPVGQGLLTVATVRTAALTALALCVPLSLAMGLGAGLLHLAAVAAAWSYNARLKATALSFLPYALAFGAVPSIVVLAPAGHGRRAGLGERGRGAARRRRPPVQRAARPRGGPRAGGARAAAPPRPSPVGGLRRGAAAGRRGPARRRSARSAGAARPRRRRLSAVVTAVGLARSRREGSRDAFLAAMVVAALSVGLLVARGAVLAPA